MSKTPKREVCRNCKYFRKTSRRQGKCTKKVFELTNAKTAELIEIELTILAYYSCEDFKQKPL